MVRPLSKFHQRLYFLRLLRTFGIDNSLLHMFYSSVVESTVLFNILTYWSNLNSGQKNIITKLQKRVARITETSIPSIEEHYISKCVSKVKLIMSDQNHPLSDHFIIMRSGKRLRVPSCRSIRYRKSFIPNSIITFNSVS